MSARGNGQWKMRRIVYSKGQDVSFEIVSGRRLIAQTIMRDVKDEVALIADDERHMRMMSAAPVMLDALKKLRDQHAPHGDRQRCWSCGLDGNSCMQFRTASDAIAEAEGAPSC